jgi:hypothetical protein
MIFIVYKTTNTINNKYYIGVHKQKTLKFDGYLGSGDLLKVAIKKYGKSKFKRSILKVFSNQEDAYEYEKVLVNKTLLSNKNNYNLKEGGQRFRNPNLAVKHSHRTLKRKYGRVDYFINSKDSKVKAIKNSIKTRTLQGKGDCMSSCRTKQAVDKKFAALNKKYGNICGQMHTEESVQKSRLNKRAKALKRLSEEIQEDLKIKIIFKDYLTGKISWEGSLENVNRDLLELPKKSNFREIRLTIDFIRGNFKKKVYDL